jgi:hypothetical protein
VKFCRQSAFRNQLSSAAPAPHSHFGTEYPTRLRALSHQRESQGPSSFRLTKRLVCAPTGAAPGMPTVLNCQEPLLPPSLTFPPSHLPTFQPPTRAIPFALIMFQTLSTPSKSYVFCFQANPNSFCKTPGYGGLCANPPQASRRVPATQHASQTLSIQPLAHTFRHHGVGGPRGFPRR